MSDEKMCPVLTIALGADQTGLAIIKDNGNIQTGFVACIREKCQWWQPGYVKSNGKCALNVIAERVE